MKRPPHLALALALAGCLDLPHPSPTAAPRVVAVRAVAGALDALPRVPSLVVTFDRAMAPPEASAVMLFREPPSSALAADARDGVVSAGRLAHRVSLRVERDASAPARWWLRAAAVLPPSPPHALFFSDRAGAVDGRPLAPTAGLDPGGVALGVVDAPCAGPVLAPAVPDAVDADAALLWLRADRPVRVLDTAAVTLAGDDGHAVAARVEADDRAADGLTRVLRVSPTRAMRPGVTYGWRVSGLTSRGALAAEEIPWRMLATPPRVEPVRLVDGVVCAAGERALGGACAEVGDRWVSLRASTTTAAVTRLEVTSAEGRRAAVSARGTTHALRVDGLPAASEVRWRLEAWDPGGRLRDARVGALRTADAAPRVRIVEVLARPYSTSAQEFIEVLNEEDGEVSLAGWTLSSGGSGSTLPDGATVPARARAVIVGASFDPRGVARAGDPPVQAGARLIVLRGSLGGRGLRDTGAEASLATPTGLVVSRYPGAAPELAPEEGVAVVRADAELDDDDPAAWARARDGASSPGGVSGAR